MLESWVFDSLVFFLLTSLSPYLLIFLSSPLSIFSLSPAPPPLLFQIPHSAFRIPQLSSLLIFLFSIDRGGQIL
jgi:hypothetical protein